LNKLEPGDRLTELCAHPAERRITPRFTWKGMVSIRVLPDGPDVVGVLLDLSEGGCGIELGMAIPAKVGASVKVSLYLDGMTLKRMGILRNIQIIRHVEKETRAGIEFMDGNSSNAKQFRLLTGGLLAHMNKDHLTSAKETLVQRWWTKISRLGG
jgi:hypothetical protein